MAAQPDVKLALPLDFEGRKLKVGDHGYDDARLIFNMRWHESQPVLITQPANVADVQVLMRYAFAHDILVAIRGGGHGIDGTSMPHNQLVIDMCSFKEIVVDLASRTVRTGAGVLLSELDAACQQHSMVVPSGTVSSTGIAGLTLGGGIGYNMRRYGATVDSLLACDVVTVDGQLVRASKAENSDLFWALCGGGGNFGIVTKFEYRLHPLRNIIGQAFLIYDLDEAKAMFLDLCTFMKTARRELSVIVIFAPIPPMPTISPEHYGLTKMAVHAVFTGDLDQFEGVINELTTLRKPSQVVKGQAPWVEVNRMLDNLAPFGRRGHLRGGYVDPAVDGVIDIIIAGALRALPSNKPGPSTIQNIWFFGGAISEDFEEDSVAFSRDGAVCMWECFAQWDTADDDAKFQAWTDTIADELGPKLRANGYINLTTDRGQEWLRGAFGSPEKYARLLAAKAKWDPKNLLRFNKNFVI
jgi:hypothetical protein